MVQQQQLVVVVVLRTGTGTLEWWLVVGWLVGGTRRLQCHRPAQPRAERFSRLATYYGVLRRSLLLLCNTLSSAATSITNRMAIALAQVPISAPKRPSSLRLRSSLGLRALPPLASKA